MLMKKKKARSKQSLREIGALESAPEEEHFVKSESEESPSADEMEEDIEDEMEDVEEEEEEEVDSDLGLGDEQEVDSNDEEKEDLQEEEEEEGDLEDDEEETPENTSMSKTAGLPTLPEDSSIIDEKPRGVVFIGHIPPVLSAQKVRTLLSKWGEIGRVFLRPEDSSKTRARKLDTGKRRVRYVDGYVEFMDKRKGKKCADLLNAQPIGGKKRKNRLRDDLWNLKYLHKFKW